MHMNILKASKTNVFTIKDEKDVCVLFFRVDVLW